MRADATKFLNFLHKANQFVIPIYQRNYSWDEKQCQQLWEDILRVGSNETIPLHFVGSIVYVHSSQSTVAVSAPLLVIDGQQRLTTLTILLEALARVLGENEPLDGFSEKKIRNKYLSNPDENDERHYKLLLSDTDKDSLMALIRGADLPKNHSLRIKENFEFFTEKLSEKNTSIEQVCRGIAKLMIVDIALERDQENPQLIFESMNSTGKALSEADLIRNYILMGLEPTIQSTIYVDLWRPMELDFGQEAYGDQFDDFMRHFLTLKTGDIPRLSEVYEAFKEYSVKYFAEDGNVRDLVSDIKKYARYFVAMALGGESNPKLKPLFDDLFKSLNYSVAYPFLMEIYSDYEAGIIEEADFIEIIKLVESYVFRRSICQIPTNSMNKTFAEFTRHIDKTDYLSSLKGHFYQLKSYRRFPADEDFKSALLYRDVYNFYHRTYLLRKLENFGKKEFVSVENLTIEHVLPQNPNLGIEWQKELGQDWKAIQERYLHTIGNLTLTGYNSEYSDRPFSEKKTMKGGFLESPLKLNKIIAAQEKWNESAILNRTNQISGEILKIWPSPNLSQDEIAKWAKAPESEKQQTTYSIEDHEYLTRPNVRELFDALRVEVMKIDPEVSETFLKYWIAYKVNTNFVDVVPKAKGLRLSINMKYPDISDPAGMTEDISEKGRWGNGDVSVHFRKLEELPYIMGLIQQSYEKQLA
ncbi:MAG: DUF262 domain-containing protein [Actinobacteria bacterium]|uniref:Unannotated protein n=1 Tax=freshwater metagenome TaxID=449393 RepID=A0A6J7DAQ1_9ZZZZ|nr:DUF262 domain-containing protein [Actinomycetota bacterium]